MQTTEWYLTGSDKKRPNGNDSYCPALTPSTSQYVLIDRHINNSVQVKLVNWIGVLDGYQELCPQAAPLDTAFNL